ncbi:FAD-dependent oxidoreductase [Agaribacter marinus]|uniref:2-octaprenyl-3-methyl-6-methoxy-1,4-benzoquinol hydroxylase n=1 Tax=Agaribacter marinus TaxID=1431249 RepID=A0AA37SWL2_9ALTE|nr:FAD-dependent oxidoreductase [Agaribacter marinus]GLR69525.1 2-octaprenyl-3-methyl-6-methoxy-1,4-benzoquinol hydroxylase [Agaribacter marinus]
MKNVDICIIGGGMIGSATALACAKQGYSVCVIEPRMPQNFHPEQAPDLRVSALNLHSINVLKDLGAWEHIINMRCKAYHGLVCWESNDAKTEFYANDVKQDKLGYFVENRILQLALLNEIHTSHKKSVTVLNDCKATNIDIELGVIALDTNESIAATIIIAADGANSATRTTCGIGVDGWAYKQKANVFSIKLRAPMPSVTWQQFTPTGPLAFLPMHDNYASLVWYADTSMSNRLQKMTNEQLQALIAATFPQALNEFELLARGGFPIVRRHAKQYYQSRLMLIGDAAHSINPLAGQGVNLGFKDISAFIVALSDGGLDKYQDVFKQYARQRRMKNLAMMTAMDVIYAGFSNDFAPIKLLRNAGLKLANNAGALKQQALKYAMGI